MIKKLHKKLDDELKYLIRAEDRSKALEYLQSNCQNRFRQMIMTEVKKLNNNGISKGIKMTKLKKRRLLIDKIFNKYKSDTLKKMKREDRFAWDFLEVDE